MNTSPATGNNHGGSSSFGSELRAIEPHGVDLASVHEHAEAEHEHGLEWLDLVRVGFVVLAAIAVWFRIWEPFPHVSLIGILATLIGGYPIFKEAYENILERKMTMELSMTIALLAALAIGEFFTTLVIAGFVLVAEILEGLTVGRGRTAIRRLIELLPPTATVRRNGSWKEVQIKEVAAGDTVLVKPGARIPVDGTVTGGHCFVDQATITGESMPAEKANGAWAYAGTINQSGALEIRVDRLGRDTTFGKIIDAVERAEKSRAPIQGIADRLAGYLVYFALGAAAITFLVTHNVRSDHFGCHCRRSLRHRGRHSARDSRGDWSLGATRLDHQRRDLFGGARKHPHGASG